MTAPWWQHAACIGHPPELWDTTGVGQRTREAREQERFAKAICKGCPVRAECLQDALDYEGSDPFIIRDTIRGGLGPRTRAVLARRVAS
jgi:WhiB family transcriptional regulator, redox-sensing transcriptional regulator